MADDARIEEVCDSLVTQIMTMVKLREKIEDDENVQWNIVLRLLHAGTHGRKRCWGRVVEALPEAVNKFIHEYCVTHSDPNFFHLAKALSPPGASSPVLSAKIEELKGPYIEMSRLIANHVNRC